MTSIGTGPFAGGDYASTHDITLTAAQGAGWYRLNAAGITRYFDGERWTDRIGIRGREWRLSRYRRFMTLLVVFIWGVLAAVLASTIPTLIRLLDHADPSGGRLFPVLMFGFGIGFCVWIGTLATINTLRLRRLMRPVPEL